MSIHSHPIRKAPNWLNHPFTIEPYQIKQTMVNVLREDLLPGGSKLRFLPALCKGATEIIYASPACGGAQVALAVMGHETGQTITIFHAARKERHEMQARAAEYGARFVPVPYGYLSNVQAKARSHAHAGGGLLLPLGFDTPAAQIDYMKFVYQVRADLFSEPDEIWLAAGSGMIARCIASAFTKTRIVAVSVGKDLHDSMGFFSPPNLYLLQHPLPFEKPTKAECPFPSCANYDRKAWEMLTMRQGDSRNILFWNVMG